MLVPSLFGTYLPINGNLLAFSIVSPFVDKVRIECCNRGVT